MLQLIRTPESPSSLSVRAEFFVMFTCSTTENVQTFYNFIGAQAVNVHALLLTDQLASPGISTS